MGANPTQAYAFSLFLIAFTLLSGALAGGGIIVGILGVAALAGSIMLFLKAKPWEHEERMK